MTILTNTLKKYSSTEKDEWKLTGFYEVSGVRVFQAINQGRIIRTGDQVEFW